MYWLLSDLQEIVRIGELFCVLELFVLTIPYVYYFYEIYKGNKPLLFQPTFFTICFFCYCIVSIPIFSISRTIHQFSKSRGDLLCIFHIMFLILVLISIALDISKLKQIAYKNEIFNESYNYLHQFVNLRYTKCLKI